MDTSTCAGCRCVKPISEFMGLRAKGAQKKFRTCGNCRNRTTQKHQSTKKRQLELENNGETHVPEIIEPSTLSDHVAQLLNVHTMQLGNTSGEMTALNFHYQLDVSTFNKSTKEVADLLVEYIEDVDEFAWMYVFLCYLLCLDHFYH
jgi:hypothetical protein